MDHMAITSTTAEARVNQALPATAVVEFMAKWSHLCPPTVLYKSLEHYGGFQNQEDIPNKWVSCLDNKSNYNLSVKHSKMPL